MITTEIKDEVASPVDVKAESKTDAKSVKSGIQLVVDPAIRNNFKSACAKLGVTKTSRLQEHMRSDIEHATGMTA